jgi:hypothetical protein
MTSKIKSDQRDRQGGCNFKSENKENALATREGSYQLEGETRCEHLPKSPNQHPKHVTVISTSPTAKASGSLRCIIKCRPRVGTEALVPCRKPSRVDSFMFTKLDQVLTNPILRLHFESEEMYMSRDHLDLGSIYKFESHIPTLDEPERH